MERQDICARILVIALELQDICARILVIALELQDMCSDTGDSTGTARYVLGYW